LLLTGLVQAVIFLRDEGNGSEDIAALLIGDYYDADNLTIVGGFR
jgi:hypothetical protein